VTRVPHTNVPSIEEQTAFYDRWNELYRRGELEEIDPEIRLRGERVLDLLRRPGLLHRGARILEVGCGTGWMGRELCRLGDLTAIDLSPRAIEIAKSRGLPGEYVAGDFLSHDFGDRSFDAVLCVETLFYVHDQAACVHKMARLLEPDGILALTAINKFVYERRSDIRQPLPGQIRHWLSRRELRRLLRPYFRILSEETLLPLGNRGILRLVNSYRLNAILDRSLGADRVRSLKERAGLGGGVIVLASRKKSVPGFG
jgi:2-polyprenyl-3-methyl-5-hydroxy-6-metoxy-1,4-benzoquinol methylase